MQQKLNMSINNAQYHNGQEPQILTVSSQPKRAGLGLQKAPLNNAGRN